MRKSEQMHKTFVESITCEDLIEICAIAHDYLENDAPNKAHEILTYVLNFEAKKVKALAEQERSQIQ
jgi:hypothetical protein